MTEKEEWVPFSWHCPNCAALVTGLKNSEGSIKVQCGRCGAAMVRKIMGRRHDIIDIYARDDGRVNRRRFSEEPHDRLF